jgi:hypothetical protein
MEAGSRDSRCNTNHPHRLIDINYSCCYERYRRHRNIWRGGPFSEEVGHILATIDACSEWWSAMPAKQGKDLFGIKRRCEFEAYGKASENWDAPWVAYITGDYTGDVEYRSGALREYSDALLWLCFHITELDRIWGERDKE